MAYLDGLFRNGWSVGGLVAFHSDYKLLLLAHSPDLYRRLGALVAEARSHDRGELEESYRRIFAQALATETTRGKHFNALQHAVAYFKTADQQDKQAVYGAIEGYAAGSFTLAQAKAVIRERALDLGVKYLISQRYLAAEQCST
ncbi:MAG: DUF1722 domain-containing protein [Actinomycetota bacterium]